MPHINTFPALIRTTIREQNYIGWDHFICGRITISWSGIISDHLQQNQIKHMNTEQWGVDLLSINWKNILDIWKQRNSETLGATETEKSEHRKKTSLEESKSCNENIKTCQNLIEY
jgi:hypothetical protein